MLFFQGINASWNKGNIIILNALLPTLKRELSTSHKTVIINVLQIEYLETQNLTCLLSAFHQFQNTPKQNAEQKVMYEKMEATAYSEITD